VSKVEVKWSNTLRSTAGVCRMKHTKSSSSSRKYENRSAVVELASKVVDNEQRLAETLLHEVIIWLHDHFPPPSYYVFFFFFSKVSFIWLHDFGDEKKFEI
jgi:hypothetical protein